MSSRCPKDGEQILVREPPSTFGAGVRIGSYSVAPFFRIKDANDRERDMGGIVAAPRKPWSGGCSGSQTRSDSDNEDVGFGPAGAEQAEDEIDRQRGRILPLRRCFDVGMAGSEH
jgi:hypothetical protein